MINQYHKREDTICWGCANAYGDGCKWFSEDKPVPGWVANRSDYKATGTSIVMRCYAVYQCPGFQQGSHRRHWEAHRLDEEGCIELITAMLTAMRQDYLEDPNQRPGIARFMLSPRFGALACGVNGEAALEQLKKEAKAYDLKRKKADHAFGTKLREIRDDYILNKKHRAKIRNLMFDEDFIKEHGLEPEIAVVVLKSYSRVYDERQRKRQQHLRAKARLEAQLEALKRREEE